MDGFFSPWLFMCIASQQDSSLLCGKTNQRDSSLYLPQFKVPYVEVFALALNKEQ